MTLLPKVKLKANVNFPATVRDGTGIDVVKSNGSYQFNLDYNDFAPPVTSLPDATYQHALVWNSLTGSYLLAPFSVFSDDKLPLTGGTLSGSLYISPAPGTVDRGIEIQQTLPSTGSLTGAIYSNLIQGSLNTEITGVGGGGTPVSANWALLQVSASVGSNYQATGGSDVGQAFGISCGLVTNGALTTDSDLSAGSFGVYNNYSNPDARMYGLTSAATVGPNGTTPFLIGAEIASSIANATPGAVDYRTALNLISYETNQAGVLDTAISVQGGNPGGQFKHVISLNTIGGTLADALSTTGDFLYSQSTQTVGNIINLPNLAVSNYVLNTEHALITGGGVMTLGDVAANGGLAVKGIAGGNVHYDLKLGTGIAGNSNWTVGMDGASSNRFYIYNVNTASNALTINATTNAVNATGDLTWTGAAWTAYTPTVTAGSGTFTTVSATGKYKAMGKTVAVVIDITVTTNGTAATSVIATLPVSVAASTSFFLPGRETASTGDRLLGIAEASAVTIRNMVTDAYPGGNGYRLKLSGVLEQA